MSAVVETAEEQLFRLRLVQRYVDVGLEECARQCNIAQQRLRAMMLEPWWAECAREVFAGQAEKLDRRFTSLIDQALDAVEDRLRNGDKIVDKFGDEQLVPVKGKDAAGIAASLLDRRQVLRGLPSSINRQEVRLDDLARKLEAFAPAPPKESVQ